MSEVCHRFEPLPQVMKNVRYKTGKPLENAGVRSAIASAARSSSRLSGRLIVRPSGTEPVIRVMGEGIDKILVEAVVDDVVEALTQVAPCGRRSKKSRRNVPTPELRARLRPHVPRLVRHLSMAALVNRAP